MSRRFYFSIFAVLALITLAVCFEPLAIAVIRWQLKTRLSVDTVHIGHFQFKSFGEVRLTDILVEKKQLYRVNAKEVRIGFRLSTIMNKEIESIAIEKAAIDYEKIKVEEFNFHADRKKDDGQLNIAKISYDKARMANIKSLVQMKGADFIFSDFSAGFLNGHINGNMKASLRDLPEYYAKLHFSDLSVERFVDDFDLDKKMEMTGILTGDLEVAGRGIQVSLLCGDFKMAAPGGKLIIKDRKLLENIVERAYLDTAVETLQDYHYNAGGLQVGLEDKNLVADVNLNGRQGKRDFKIVYHPPRGFNRR